MLSPDYIVQDIDAEGWTNLVSLADRDTVYKILGEERKKKPPRSRLIVLYHGDIVHKAWHSEKGSMLKDFTWSGPKNLDALAAEYGVDRVIAVERGVIAEIHEQFQKKILLKEDYPKQLFHIFDAIRSRLGVDLNVYPEPKIPHLSYDTVNQMFKIFVPDNSTIVFYIFEGNKVWGSAIVGVKDSDFNLFTSHDALLADGFSVGSWRKDYRKILGAVKRKFGEPSIGCFADLVSFARIMRSRKGLKALAAARKAGDVILDPLPMRIKGLLSAGKLFGK